MIKKIKENATTYLTIFLLGASFASSLFFFTNSTTKEADPAAAEVEKEENEISDKSLQYVEMQTRMFLYNFNESNQIDEQELTDITFEYFNPQFLENEFSVQKSALFGLYGYEKLMSTFTSTEGLKQTGAIQSFEITSLEKDNSKQTITSYIIMDTYELNTVHWIEWRNIPGKGWKINALSFNGNIESLETPLSPKKTT